MEDTTDRTKELERQFAPQLGLFGSTAATKPIMQQLLEIIESKNSWGKNELKDELLKLLVKR